MATSSAVRTHSNQISFPDRYKGYVVQYTDNFTSVLVIRVVPPLVLSALLIQVCFDAIGYQRDPPLGQGSHIQPFDRNGTQLRMGPAEYVLNQSNWRSLSAKILLQRRMPVH